MRISLRLLLIASVAACAPMLPEAPPVAPTPAVSAPQPAPRGPATPAPAPVAPAPVVVDQAGFDGWKQGFLTRHGGARRAEYERELSGLEPDPSVIRLDRNQPEFSRPVGVYVQSAASATRRNSASLRNTPPPPPNVQSPRPRQSLPRQPSNKWRNSPMRPSASWKTNRNKCQAPPRCKPPPCKRASSKK